MNDLILPPERPTSSAFRLRALAKMREPFPDHQVSLLPKQMKKEDTDKGRCEIGTRYCADDQPCGGYHARSVHLSYVGHAALTDRLLDADPEWSWEPVCVDDQGAPALNRDGLFCIRLTVAGMTRLGVGEAPDSKGKGNAMKERIGDALRNAGMRFGAALEFWHKGTLHLLGQMDDEEDDAPRGAQRQDDERPNRPAEQPPSREFYPADKFAANLETWRKVIIEKGKKQIDVIKTIESGGFALTAEQRETIMGI